MRNRGDILIKVSQTVAFSFFCSCSNALFFFIGVKHHGGESLIYGQRYDRGDALIGVRLDMCRGTLEFFHNRIPLGECDLMYSN